MNKFAKAGVASALVLSAVSMAMPASAGGLSGFPRWGGEESFKGGLDTYKGGYETFKGAPAPVAEPVAVTESGRKCYWRIDAGISISPNPSGEFYYEDYLTAPYTYELSNTSKDNGAVVDAGVGCAFGSRFRGDLVFSWRSDKEFHGDPYPNDPIWGKLASHTLMANVYYDFDLGRSFKPYVGVGLGVAYHSMDDVLWTDLAYNNWVIAGKEDVNIAWSAMAGVSYDYSDRITFDLGYRYIDMGEVSSQRYVLNGASQIVAGTKFENITAHEIKAGVRVNFDHVAAVADVVPFK